MTKIEQQAAILEKIAKIAAQNSDLNPNVIAVMTLSAKAMSAKRKA